MESATVAPFRLSKTPRRALFARSERKGRAASTLAVPPFLQNRGRFRISWLLFAWAPPIRTYLGASPFFGRPLGGAFDVVPSVPGFHHPQVASVNELSTTPRQHGHRQDESHRKDISEYDRIVYEILATPSGSVTAPAAGAESGRTLHAVDCVHRDVLPKPSRALDRRHDREIKRPGAIRALRPTYLIHPLNPFAQAASRNWFRAEILGEFVSLP